MTAKDLPALFARHMCGLKIAGIEAQDGKLIIWRETGVKNVALHVDRICGPIKELSWQSSFDSASVDVSKWVNSDVFKAPNSTIPNDNPVEPKMVDPLKFLGRTIQTVGVYEKVHGRNRHITVSMRTILGDVETKKTKVETLVLGLVVDK